jgi:hypothetical protein
VRGGGRKVIGLRDDGEVVAMRAEHALHEEVGADEGVETDAFARLAQEGCNGDRLADRGHVALLAGLLVAIVAVQPLEIGHLLGKTGRLVCRQGRAWWCKACGNCRRVPRHEYEQPARGCSRPPSRAPW